MLIDLLEFKKTERKWHLPVLAGLCIGVPVLGGYFTGHLQDGKLASMVALVILYIQSEQLSRRMIILMTCSFGMLVSFMVGLLFSFNPYVAALVLGLYAFVVHLVLYYLNMVRPPGNFFFIMIAAVTITLPHDITKVTHNLGLAAVGTIVSCVFGLVYSLITLRRAASTSDVVAVTKNQYINLIESLTYGFFVGLSLLVGYLLELENPYWVPTSCAAVMQGVSTTHIWQRSAQRVLGTFIGLILTWFILLLKPSLLTISLSIILLQIVVEFFVVRNYGFAVIFITVLTIFLAETGNSLTVNPTTLITARFFDILTGSLIGAFGGWILYSEKLRFLATRQMRLNRIKTGRRRYNKNL